MKKLALLVLLAIELTLTGCGSSPTSTAKAADGTWESALIGTDAGVGVFNFLTKFSVGANNALSVSYFSFLTTGPCFPLTGETTSGTFTVTSATTTSTSANFQFTVKSGASSLAVTGTAAGTTDSSSNTTWSTITGTWTLTGGSGCTGSGTFTMTRS
jgi:hypothetical protein